MPSLSDFDVSSLENLLASWGAAPSNARPFLRYFYNSGGTCLGGTARLGEAMLTKLVEEFTPRSTSIIARRVASDGTVKLLVEVTRATGNVPVTRNFQYRVDLSMELQGQVAHTTGQSVECVLMPSHLPDRAGGCVSSQVGCAMGCDFCASTKSGVERSLTSGEIVEQFLWLRAEGLKLGRRIQTIVFMGMGEPLLNYENVVAAIHRIAGNDLGAIGYKHVTVSTVGIVPGIHRLRQEKLGVHLAVSLHAPDDETRSAIVPTGKRYKVAEILYAVRAFENESGTMATIEYTMLDGVNDSDAQAMLLAELLMQGAIDRSASRNRRPRVNLIPYNWIGAGVSGREYRQPPIERMQRFLQILRDHGIVAHFRKTRGQDIEGACGQLREKIPF